MVLPPGWRDLAGQPDSAPTSFGRLMPGSPAGYGYHWWVVPPLPGGVNNGAFSANGVYGQIIFVNPTEQVVVAIQSAWRQPHDSDAAVENIAMQSRGARASNGPGVVGLQRGERSGPSMVAIRAMHEVAALQPAAREQEPRYR